MHKEHICCELEDMKALAFNFKMLIYRKNRSRRSRHSKEELLLQKSVQKGNATFYSGKIPTLLWSLANKLIGFHQF